MTTVAGTVTELNLWLTCALWLTWKFILCGAAWVWLFPSDDSLSSSKKYARTTVLSILISLLFTSLSTVVAGELGLYTDTMEFILLFVFTITGTALGFRKNSQQYLKLALPAAGIFFTCAAAIMLIPNQGEWLKGGWDPGVYMNTGASLARTGTFYPADTFFNQAIPENEQKLFLRFAGKRIERFPGVMQDKDRQSLHFHFFRLTPALIGSVCRAGGLRAAVRTNVFIGLCALMCFLGTLMCLSGPALAITATVLLAMQPVFLYHLHIPVAEMTELCLLCGAFLIIGNKEIKQQFLLALVMFALVINKLSFLPFGAVLVFITAWDSKDEKPLRSTILLSSALALGTATDIMTSPASALGWKVLPVLLSVSAFFIVTALIIPQLKTFIPKIMEKNLTLIIPALTGLSLTVMFLLPEIIPNSQESANLIRIVRYIGWPVFVLALAGGVCFAFDADRKLNGIVFFLLSVTLIVLVKKHIVDVYPWATRRYVSCALPLAALCAAHGLVFLRNRLKTVSKTAASFFVPAALLSIFALSLPMQIAAFTKTEGNGLSEILAEVTAQIGPEDIVVADHFSLGTPLACIYGKQVLNGERILKRHGKEPAEQAFSMLEKLSRQGRRIRFLTTTDKALTVYPIPLENVTLDREFTPHAFGTIKHHRNMTGFVTEKEEPKIKLWSLT